MSIEVNELIKIGSNTATMEFTYCGPPEKGMLAWIDGEEMKLWWKADSVIIEPFSGGIFYLTWKEVDLSVQHAIYGVVDRVDTENHIVEVSKIMYVFPGGKMGHIHLHIQLQKVSEQHTRFLLVHTHSYQGQQQKLYNAAVQTAWPKTITLLKNYLEK